jgi:heme a synthase
MLENKLAFRIICLSVMLAFIVILLGATTRLRDAGLACPDWPGCYGKWLVSQQPTANNITEQPLNPNKAWAEMIHRYAAAALVLLSFSAITLILHKRKHPEKPLKTTFSLLIVLFLQGLLGKWTVTLQLHPLVVMSHLLGGLSLLSLLWILLLHFIPLAKAHPYPQANKLQLWAIIGLGIVIIQIALGGWTSSNYAAFVCPDFPKCQGQWWPNMDFAEGFRLWLNFDKNFEGGLLSTHARTAIQMCHRIGALFTTLYLIFLVWQLHSYRYSKPLRLISLLILLFLTLQIGLGILNVIWLLALPVAVAHNAVAALLLLTLITLNLYLTKIKS